MIAIREFFELSLSWNKGAPRRVTLGGITLITNVLLNFGLKLVPPADKISVRKTLPAVFSPVEL